MDFAPSTAETMMTETETEKRYPVLVNLSTNEKHILNSASITLGRAPENNVILEEDGYASANHARIYWDNGWWVEDLMSSNGTAVNDQLLNSPHQLMPNDIIKVGRTLFRIE